MGYKAFVCMNIAIIGNGKLTVTLAQGLALAGHDVFIGIKESETIIFNFLPGEFDNIHVTSIDDAAYRSDVIIMATSPEEVRETAYLLDDVRRKVIVDTTFMNFTRFGNYVNTVSAIQAITGTQHVVKCFNSLGYETLGPVKKDDTVQMFMAGDSKKSKEMLKLLARDLGFAYCHDFGSSNEVPILDEMAICWHNLSVRQSKGEKISIKITRH